MTRKARMTNVEWMTKPEWRHLVIRHSFVISASSFVILPHPSPGLVIAAAPRYLPRSVR